MRWIFRILSVVAVLAGLAFVTLALIPSDRIAALAAAEFARLTGRQLVIEGAVQPSLWPVVGVETGRISLANAEWSQSGPMLRAEGLAIGVDLAALLQGRLRITRLDLQSPQILLERAEDGVGNWTFGPAGGDPVPAAQDSVATPVSLLSGRIRDGRLVFVDHATGRRADLSGIEATASLPEAGGAADLALTAVMAGGPVALTARLDAVAPLLAGAVAPLSLTARAGAARLEFQGRASAAPLAAEGRLTADLSDLADLAAALALPPPALPEGWGARAVTLEGDLTVTAERSLHLRDAALVLDGRPIRGDADIYTGGPRPRIVAQVTAGDLSLGRGDPSGAGGSTAAAGWSTTAIDASALGLADADIGFRAAGLALGPLRLGAVNGRLALDRSRAVLTLAEVAAYQGALSGTLVANGRDGLSVSADLALKGVALQPLLTDLGATSRLVAQGDMATQLLGGGTSVAAIVESLSGNLQVRLGAGRIEGLDLAGILATLDPARAQAGGDTAFDRLEATFAIAGGQMTGDDLQLDGRLVTATGAGRIGLGSRDIDYRLRPVARTGADGTGGLGLPVWITGPWADPQIRLDLEALTQERFGAEAEAAEAEARARARALEDELRQKAADELGAAQGEDLEDAARRKLEEELQRQIGETLNDLLGSN